MCSECTKFRKKKKRLELFSVSFAWCFIRKKKPHNNKPQTINTDLCLCFDVMMMS